MYGLLLTILVLNGIALCVIILLQAGKGGGLAAMGGGVTSTTEGVLGGRQASEFLVRATWAGGALFILLALILSIMSSRGFEAQPILQPGEQEAVPSPVIPGSGAGEAPPPAEPGPADPGSP